MRDALTYDLLAVAGLPAVEVIDDTVIERVFGDDDGNIYGGGRADISLAAQP